MAGIRDDSAGNYGTWDSSDLSWLDFIKATGSDVGNGAYNALSNITGALSPIGTSPEGNMALQVPPMITGNTQNQARQTAQQPTPQPAQPQQPTGLLNQQQQVPA